MIAQKLRKHDDHYEIRIKHSDLITTLKNTEDEDKYNVFKFPIIPEYDHELHSEAALSALFVILGEVKENLSH